MKVIKEISAIQNISDYYKSIGKSVALVPTMGYLHEGHTSLILKAKDENEIVVVSIFVNPTQFGKNEDFDKYPRDFLRDFHICEKAGADIIFNPERDEIYKKGSLTYVTVPDLSDKLEGKLRAGHFTGVATIVLKLLNSVKPDNLYLGQKDAQQNVIIKKMVDDLNIDVKINVCETIRDDNGLALSSRNSYLSFHEKETASTLFFLLNECKRLIMQENVIDSNDIKEYICKTLKDKSSDMALEYLEITDNNSLDPIDNLQDHKGEILISLSAKIRDVRLIDNIIIKK